MKDGEAVRELGKAATGVMAGILAGMALFLVASNISIMRNVAADPLTVCIDNRANLTEGDLKDMQDIAGREVVRIFGKRVEFGCGSHRLQATLMPPGEWYNGSLIRIKSQVGYGAYNPLENWIIFYPYDKTESHLDYLAVDGGMLAHEIGHAIGYPHRSEEDSIMHRKAPCVLASTVRCEREGRRALDPVIYLFNG